MRGQSETIGVVLLLVVVVGVSTTVGVAALTTFSDAGDRGNAATLADVTVATDELVIDHTGGEPLDPEAVAVQVRDPNGTTVYDLGSDGSLDGEPPWSPGDRWTLADPGYGPGDEVTVLVIHRPSNTIVTRTTRRVPATPAEGGEGGDGEDGDGGDGDPTETTETTTQTTEPTETDEPTETTEPGDPELVIEATNDLDDGTTLSEYEPTVKLRSEEGDARNVKVTLTLDGPDSFSRTKEVGDVDAGSSVSRSFAVGRLSEGEYEWEVDVDAENAEAAESEGEFEVGDTISMRVEDLSHEDTDRGQFVTSVDVEGTSGDFSHVRIVHENVDDGSATETASIDATRGSVRYALRGGTYGDEFSVHAEVVYDDNEGGTEVVATRSLEVTAGDGSPDENDDLSTGTSPEFDTVDIETSGNSGKHTVDYKVDGSFDRVEAYMIGGEEAGYDNGTSTKSNGRIKLEPGYGDEFEVVVLLYDEDGAVVERRVEEVEADD